MDKSFIMMIRLSKETRYNITPFSLILYLVSFDNLFIMMNDLSIEICLKLLKCSTPFSLEHLSSLSKFLNN